MFCSKCGSPIAEEYAFCAKCGSPTPQAAPLSETSLAVQRIKVCPECGNQNEPGARFCGQCGGAGHGGAASAAPSARLTRAAQPPSEDRADLQRQGLHFTEYPVWVMVLLSILTLGTYTTFWLNHWHGVMPKRRSDDPSTAKAIWFLFIPLYNIYWLFESLLRLCTRLDEELADAGLPDRVPKELIRWFCILTLVPYVNYLAAPILGGIATGKMQSLVNLLAHVHRSVGPSGIRQQRLLGTTIKA